MKTGDILVVDYTGFDGSGGVIKVNPKTGKQTAVSSNDQPVNQGSSEFFGNPWSLAITPSGQLLVADGGAGGGVVGVDPATGKESIVSSDNQAINSGSAYFGFNTGIVRLPSGRLAVATSSATSGVIGVDPKTGKQSLISTNTMTVNSSVSEFFSSPYGLATDGRGSLMVADSSAFSDGRGGIIGVDPATGKESVISNNLQPVNASSQHLFHGGPSDLELYRGTLYVSDSSGGVNGGGAAVIGVNPKTGKQRLVSGNAQPVNSSSQLFHYPYGLAVEPGGRILVGDEFAFADLNGGVIGVNGKTGKQSVVSSNLQPVNAGSSDLFTYVDGVLVVPPRCGGQYATIVGSSGRDKLTGTRFPDVIAGLGGRDKISGLAGPDRLCGGKGPDKLIGGKGKDKLNGGKGRDQQIQ